MQFGPLDLTDPDTTTTTGQVQSPVVASGTYAVVAGNEGIEGLEYAQTVIADSNRLVGLDPGDNAVWSMDSTFQQTYAGIQGPYDNEAGVPGATLAVSKVALNRPSSISQLGANDYLMADTGNNRCVRVDRSGQVLWELSTFSDPIGLLGPGASLSLNQPQGVVVWRDTYTDTTVTPNVTYTTDHYLIADTGNFRVLEIDDQYYLNSGGAVSTTTTTGLLPVPTRTHYLVWASHTQDKFQRKYRFVAAQRFTDATGVNYILAAVANRNVAPLTTDNSGGASLDIAAKDSDGSSLLFLGYQPLSTQTGNAYPVYGYGGSALPAVTNYSKYSGLPSLVVSTIRTTGTPTYLPMRDLRFMTIYTPPGTAPGSTAALDHVMICDDDGVFDGLFTQASTSLPGAPIVVDTTANGGFSFQTADYSSFVTNYNAIGTNSEKLQVNPNFVPSSAQKLDNGDYLICNSASAGNPSSDTTNGAGENVNFAGVVFEINQSKAAASAYVWSRPHLTGPLSQPAFALRPM